MTSHAGLRSRFVEGAEELAEDHGLELLEREAAGGHVVPGAPEALGAGVERGVGEALGRELLQEAAHGARHVGRQARHGSGDARRDVALGGAAAQVVAVGSVGVGAQRRKQGVADRCHHGEVHGNDVMGS